MIKKVTIKEYLVLRVLYEIKVITASDEKATICIQQKKYH